MYGLGLRVSRFKNHELWDCELGPKDFGFGGWSSGVRGFGFRDLRFGAVGLNALLWGLGPLGLRLPV